jgi:anti-sigma28 factor (negative regulator of flagellin synthesis)
MDDFCDCSQCPHHCSGDEEIVLPANGNDDTATTTSSDDSGEVSDDEDASSFAKASADKDAEAMAVKKVEKLKKAIESLGFKLENTAKGIRVTL